MKQQKTDRGGACQLDSAREAAAVLVCWVDSGGSSGLSFPDCQLEGCLEDIQISSLETTGQGASLWKLRGKTAGNSQPIAPPSVLILGVPATPQPERFLLAFNRGQLSSLPLKWGGVWTARKEWGSGVQVLLKQIWNKSPVFSSPSKDTWPLTAKP